MADPWKVWEGRHKRDRQALESLLSDLNIDWPQCGAYAGPGWFPIVKDALEALIAAGWNRKLGQVKQKFCQLRIYLDGPNTPEDWETFRAITDAALDRSNTTCEECGGVRDRPGLRAGQPICTPCEETFAQESRGE